MRWNDDKRAYERTELTEHPDYGTWTTDEEGPPSGREKPLPTFEERRERARVAAGGRYETRFTRALSHALVDSPFMHPANRSPLLQLKYDAHGNRHSVPVSGSRRQQSRRRRGPGFRARTLSLEEISVSVSEDAAAAAVAAALGWLDVALDEDSADDEDYQVGGWVGGWAGGRVGGCVD